MRRDTIANETHLVRRGLKHLIADAGLSYDQVAAHLGMTKNNLASILNARQHLRFEHAAMIANAVEDLTGGTDPGARPVATFFLRLYSDAQDRSEMVAEVRRLVHELVREEREAAKTEKS
jgi:transcriptional regulator with XRE-family HTH domain